MKISMIVIGRNEAGTLPSICNNFAELSRELNHETELIFVDSDSSDNSMSIVTEFRDSHPGLRITATCITGNVNAAAGRNEGLNHLHSDSEYIFFLDGDIVFNRQFVHDAVSILENDRETGTVTGVIYDCYTGDSLFRRETPDKVILKHHGGNFVTRKEVVQQVGRFDENLVKHQDIDYTFRIREKGYKLSRIDTVLGYHHTVHYLDFKRVLRDLKAKKHLSTGRLFRKYIFTKFIGDLLFRGSIKASLLRLFLVFLLLSSAVSLYMFAVWIVCMILFLGRVQKSRGENMAARLLSILNSFQFLAGIFMKPQK